LAESPPQLADNFPEEQNLVLGDGGFINDHLFLVHLPQTASPLPLAGWVDRESLEPGKQFAMQIHDHLWVDGLPIVIRERHIEAAGGETHFEMVSPPDR
jgi:hypothetical protein